LPPQVLASVLEHIYHKIAEELLENAISVNDQIVDLETVFALREEAITDYENGEFDKARIGKGIVKTKCAGLIKTRLPRHNSLIGHGLTDSEIT
jgi:hypothetical protein